jgi:(1->4)-alpha-D-glucan 1-alpha-D-glucosylmutase
MEAYAIKAAREGKVETSWINPDDDYESGIKHFLRQMLDRRASGEFIAQFDALARRTALLGALNSLSQLALKATMPGVPDFYQGTELWDLSLVDPDNRRPVDFAGRAAALDQLASNPDWAALAAAWPDGRIKLALTHQLIRLRNAHPALFTDGSYRPIEVAGPHRDHVLAFARESGREAIVVAVGRVFAPFTESGRQWPGANAWDATLRLDRFASLTDALIPNRDLSGSEVAVSALFDPLPVAILRGSPIRKPVSRRRGESAAEPAVAQ